MENNMELEKKMAENVEEEKKGGQTKTKQLGGIKAMPFILANEACDRFAASGFFSNIITYLTKELNLPLVKASNTLTNFAGTLSFTPLIGAIIADSYAGRYWTIIVGSVFYLLGMVSITVSAILPQFHPPPCPTQENCQEASSSQLSIFYLSLLLIGVGVAGLRPCLVTFAADQFDMKKSTVESRGWNFFNWYYFAMGFATLIALTVIVYIQDNVGWGWGLGIPTIFMGFSIVIFILGSPLYNKVKPGGSPTIRLVQVIVAAVKKRNVVAPEDPGLLYASKELDANISSDGRLVHTSDFSWFDRAAVITEGDIDESNQPNLWRLATVHRVEELKTIIRVLPIWGAGILLIAAESNLYSFTIQQADTMDRHLSHSFEIPAASMTIFSVLTFMIGLVLYERLFVPFVRRFTGNPIGITLLQRMGIGFVINIFTTAVSALVEIKRKQVAARYNLLDKPTAVIPISVFWLLPQYCLDGLSDVFMSVSHLEFLYDQSPESMRSTAVALYSITIAIGNYLGSFLTSMVHKYTGKERNWLPDRNLNRGRLENFYWLATGIQVVNFIYFVICAWNYTCKPLEEITENKEETDVELAKDKSLLDHSKVNGETELPRIGTY